MEMTLMVVCLSLFCAVVTCLTFVAATRGRTPARPCDEDRSHERSPAQKNI